MNHGKLIQSWKVMTEAATGGVLKKLFLKLSQNSQKNTSVRVSCLIKFQAEACTFYKRDSGTEVFL